MIFIIISVVVPIAVWISAPLILGWLRPSRPKRDALLAAACILFFVSWYLPSPLIEGRNTAFTTHFVGGGIFSGLLWLYAARYLRWNTSWPVELASVYAFVSALGVANELFELAAVRLHLTRISGSDTWWDLLANTLGALIFWVGYRLVRATRHSASRSV